MVKVVRRARVAEVMPAGMSTWRRDTRLVRRRRRECVARRMASSERKTIPEKVKSERPRTCCRARLGRGPKLERMRVRSANVASEEDVSLFQFHDHRG